MADPSRLVDLIQWSNGPLTWRCLGVPGSWGKGNPSEMMFERTTELVGGIVVYLPSGK